eukprot:jgi/Antlo1/898/436
MRTCAITRCNIRAASRMTFDSNGGMGCRPAGLKQNEVHITERFCACKGRKKHLERHFSKGKTHVVSFKTRRALSLPMHCKTTNSEDAVY